MNLSNMTTPRKAFTLIELLTVIAIIAVLAAILIPVVGNIRNKATMTNCSSSLRTLHASANLYAQDNGGYLMPSSKQVGDNTNHWPVLVLDFLGYSAGNDDLKRDISCPSYDGNANGTYWMLGYAYNETPAYYGPSAQSEYSTPQFKRSRQNTRIKDGSGTKFGLHEVTFPEARVMFAEADDLWHLTGTNSDMASKVATHRHGTEFCNAIFFDGHVEQLTPEEVQLSVGDVTQFIKQRKSSGGEG